MGHMIDMGSVAGQAPCFVLTFRFVLHGSSDVYYIESDAAPFRARAHLQTRESMTTGS